MPLVGGSPYRTRSQQSEPDKKRRSAKVWRWALWLLVAAGWIFVVWDFHDGGPQRWLLLVEVGIPTVLLVGAALTNRWLPW